jgi:short-subunit dehydrogenase
MYSHSIGLSTVKDRLEAFVLTVLYTSCITQLVDQPATILITGATAGIGRHLALDLAARGHRVIATGRNAEALATLEVAARAQNLPIRQRALDVTDAASIAAARAAVLDETGGRGIDVLINNAGYGQTGPLLALDDATLRRQFDTNVFGLMAVTRAFAPEMVARGDGCVINVSSTSGRITFPFFGAYSASKYAVEALSDALRLELQPFGVRVVVVEPGPVRSSFAERAIAALPPHAETGYASVYARADALRATTDRHAVEPERVARVVRRAIGSRRPRARYLVPGWYELLFGFASLVPTRWLDRLLRRGFGLEASPPAPKAREAVTR